MKVADEVWVAVALLHRENPARGDFAVQEIKARAKRENWLTRPGFSQHVSYHCVASKPADPVNHRMLHEDSRGRRRLYREGDPCHPERENGKIRPEQWDLSPEYKSLVDWYDRVYSKQPSTPVPVLAGATFESASHGADRRQHLPRAAFVTSAGAFVIPDNLRKELGIEEGTRLSIYREADHLVLQPVTAEFIHSLRGCCKGEGSLVEDREREHKIEKDRMSHE
ncbi:MAG: AbrB/MazE/SpoVT family DNA-binding domain-containing protein [Terriglobales bacterium]|jgi:AbrB family looped-hinge helix DNA binding protein